MDNFLTIVTGGHADTDLIGDGWTATAELQRTFLSGSRTELTGEELELADFATMNRIRARVDDVVTDPRTAQMLKPWYRYMCKRPTFSDHYLQTFNRPNVTLVDTADTGGITAMTDLDRRVHAHQRPGRPSHQSPAGRHRTGLLTTRDCAAAGIFGAPGTETWDERHPAVPVNSQVLSARVRP